nr:PDZ domain-containing protein [Acidobacteriota bacterium]
YDSPRAWMNERRRVDYYYEGSLIWLEADVLIRRKSGGKLSLDNFMRKFHGGQNTAPLVLTYDFDEVVRTLNAVTPYDWRKFLIERVYTAQKNAPLGGITDGGWKLVYNETPNVQGQIDEQTRKFISLAFSIGVIVNSEGTILDVNPDLAAAKAGLAPGMKIINVNGQGFSGEVLHTAIAATKNGSSPIKLIADNGGFKETYNLEYQGGERYPHLERDTAKTDLLSEVIKSH